MQFRTSFIIFSTITNAAAAQYATNRYFGRDVGQIYQTRDFPTEYNNLEARGLGLDILETFIKRHLEPAEEARLREKEGEADLRRGGERPAEGPAAAFQAELQPPPGTDAETTATPNGGTPNGGTPNGRRRAALNRWARALNTLRRQDPGQGPGQGPGQA